MQELLATLDTLDEGLAALVGEAAESLWSGTDDEIVALLQVVARIGRRVDALSVEAVGEVGERSRNLVRDERMTSRFGCRSTGELVQRATLCDARAAAKLERASRATYRERALTTGQPLPAQYPALRLALLGGVVDVDGLVSAVAPMAEAGCRLGRDAKRLAERQLASAAWGRPLLDDEREGSEGEGSPDLSAEPSPPATAEDLRILAKAIVAYLDQDGAPPTDSEAMRRRGLTLGVAREGLVPVSGRMLPDVAAQLQMLFDSILSPKNAARPAVTFGPDDGGGGQGSDAPVDDEPPVDHRTRAQKQHDALATVLGVAARAGELPTIGGAAPTLVVTVRAEDYIQGTGFAQVEGSDEPVPIEVARQTACCGSIQRVLFDEGGRIVGIATSDRVFNAHQRRAIHARDGGCVIPGCHVGAGWCELHHVTEHARGGPTHTDNGVPLCWFHHRTLEHSGWKVRMNAGVPEVRGPLWWDPYLQWRPARPLAGLVPV